MILDRLKAAQKYTCQDEWTIRTDAQIEFKLDIFSKILQGCHFNVGNLIWKIHLNRVKDFLDIALVKSWKKGLFV